MLRCFLSVLLFAPVFAAELKIYTTGHLVGQGGLAEYYQASLESSKSAPHFQSHYPHLAKTNINFVGFVHTGHIRRALKQGAKPDLVLGILDYEAEEMRDKGLCSGTIRVFAESPLTFMVRNFGKRKIISLFELAQIKSKTLFPHPQLSTQGRDMMALLKAEGVKLPRVVYTNSWSEAYARFLFGEAPYVLTYAASSLFHTKCAEELREAYAPVVFVVGHLFHRYVAVGVSEKPVIHEFLRFLAEKRHEDAIRTIFYMYPPGQSPHVFKEDQSLQKIVSHNYQKILSQHERGTLGWKFFAHVLITLGFALIAGTCVIVTALLIGALDMFAGRHVRMIVSLSLGSMIMLPQVLLIPVLQHAWPVFDGWVWVFAFEVWYGVALIGLALIASNNSFPASLLKQTQQLSLSAVSFVRYVYLPQVLRTQKPLLLSVPLILFGTCGAFLFVAPMDYPSLSMFLLRHTQTGADWVFSIYTFLPYMVVALLVFVQGRPLATKVEKSKAIHLTSTYASFLLLMVVSVLYLWPVLRLIMFNGSVNSVLGAFGVSVRLLETTLFTLGVMFAAVGIGASLFKVLALSVLNTRLSIKFILALGVFTLIAPRFTLMSASTNQTMLFVFAQAILAIGVFIWLGSGLLENIQRRYAPLVKMNKIGFLRQYTGIILPALGLPVLRTSVLVALTVLNEFVVASAFALTSPITLTRYIYLMLGRYKYAEALSAGVILVSLNLILMGIYVSLNNKEKRND